MAEVIPATIQRRRDNDAKVEKIHKLFHEAEDKLKKAEQQCNGLHIPSLNELRYAGHHLLNGLNAVVPAEIVYEFQEAESHCKRAMFDAVEIRLIDYLQRIDKSELDFESIEIIKILPDYINLRGKYLSVKETLMHIEHTCRENYLELCEEQLVHLEAYSSAIDHAKPEFQRALSRERRDSRRFILALTVAILTLAIAIAIVGVAVAYYHK